MICSLARSFRSSVMLMAKKDFYKILGVPASAGEAEIKKAYFKLAKELHPDVNKAKDAKEKFATVSEAYETLSDSEKRQIYDSTGMTADEQSQQGFNRGGGGFGFNPHAGFGSSRDFNNFQDMFREFDEFFSGRQQTKKVYKGEDINLTMEVSFVDSILGTQKTITLERKTVCGTCHGSRAKPGTSPTKCLNCSGRGVVFFQRGGMSIQVTCQKCKGAGTVIKNSCTACKGAGLSNKQEDEKINLPPGINSGQNIKLSGKGHNAESGGPSGDLLIKVLVQPHPVFRRDGQNIVSDVPITMSQAVLGCNISIETICGLADLTIPSGTHNGTEIRLKDHGVPSLPPRQHRKGEHVAILRIKTPQRLSAKMKELYHQLAKEEGVEVTDSEGFFSKVFKP